jgi:Protein of unknown function DUF104
MTTAVKAIYEGGVFKPLEPLRESDNRVFVQFAFICDNREVGSV